MEDEYKQALINHRTTSNTWALISRPIDIFCFPTVNHRCDADQEINHTYLDSGSSPEIDISI